MYSTLYSLEPVVKTRSEIELVKVKRDTMTWIYDDRDISTRFESEQKLNCVFFIIDPAISRNIQTVVCVPDWEDTSFSVKYVVIGVGDDNKLISPTYEYIQNFRKRRLVSIHDDNDESDNNVIVDNTLNKLVNVQNIKIFIPRDNPLLYNDYVRYYKITNKLQLATSLMELQSYRDGRSSIPSAIMQHNIAPYVSKAFKGGKTRKNRKRRSVGFTL